MFFAPDEILYCLVVGGGAQHKLTNILIFKFIVLRLVIDSVFATILERLGNFFCQFRVHVIWVSKLKIGVHLCQ